MKIQSWFIIILLGIISISCSSSKQTAKKHLSEKEIKENDIPINLAPQNTKRKVQNILNKRNSKIQIKLEKAKRGK